MSEPPVSPTPATPNGLDVVRVLVARLNADHASDEELPACAERVRAATEGAALRWQHDRDADWWNVEADATVEPAHCEAKLTRLDRGRWRLWVARGAAGAERLIAPCALAVELVEALRGGRDSPGAIAGQLAARTGAHIGLEAGRLTVTTADGRRCRGLVATGADGLPSLFVLDGDAWAGAAGTVSTPEGPQPRDA
jgi:hypothetical protein